MTLVMYSANHSIPVALVGAALLAAALPASGATNTTQLEAESVALAPSSAGRVFDDSLASKAKAQLLWTNASVTFTLSAPIESVTVRAKGDQCAGAPVMALAIDGVVQGSRSVSSTAWSSYSYALPQALPQAAHTVTVTYLNDPESASCDRNLRLDWLSVSMASTPTTPAPPGASPAPPAPATTKLYVDPNSTAARQVASLKAAGKTAEATKIQKIAGQSQAVWLGGWSSDDSVVSAALKNSAADRSRAVFAIYGIPYRDGGSYSAGGLPSAAAYKAWIEGIGGKVGNHPTTMILEPDAVAMVVPEPVQTQRWSLLQYAITKLGALPYTRVYLDAGHSGWHTTADITARLKKAGIGLPGADGFALNVAGTMTSESQTTYGRAISAGVGSKPFVIDTGRNGNGPLPGATGEAAWCNPRGRALGAKPTMSTGVANVDAYLWVQRPGESNGSCNGDPKAGAWFQQIALELATLAKW